MSFNAFALTVEVADANLRPTLRPDVWSDLAIALPTTHTLADPSTSERPTTWAFPTGALRVPLIIAHRGGVASAPENTLPAFQSAFEHGADGIELDVRMTRDSQLVVYHDRSLDRIGGRRGLVSNATLAEMRALDAGGWFAPEYRGVQAPTLDEVFELLPSNSLVNVEMKAVIHNMRLIAHRVADVIRRHDRWDSTLVASFNPISLWELRRIEPRIMRGYIWSRRHPPPISSRIFSPLVKAHWYDPSDTSYNPRLMRSVRARGVRTLAWDVDFDCDLSQMADARLDATVTDNLETLLQQRRQLIHSQL